MSTTKPRMVLIAVLVCFFAIGMAGLLNFFKYRSTAESIVSERLLVTGNAIERSIEQSLAIGLQLSGLDSLQATMERELGTDDLTSHIEVFDAEGLALYTTDRQTGLRKMPPEWLESAHRAGKGGWFVRHGADSAAGISIETNFGLTVGYVAVRYDSERVREAENAVAWELAKVAAGVFAVAATLASLALIGVMNGLARQVQAVEAALPSIGTGPLPNVVRKGPFGPALARFMAQVREAETQINVVRGHLARGVKQ